MRLQTHPHALQAHTLTRMDALYICSIDVGYGLHCELQDP